MRQDCKTVAERISESLEEASAALLDKLCEGEPEQVRRIAWTMFATRVAFGDGLGSCFVLPPVEEC